MAFLVGILRQRPELANPSFVIQVDRNDLDNQLHDQFVLARGLVDILVADYHASSMLAATFQIVAQGLADLPAATRLVSDTPARAVGLTDRGAIVAGRRADLLVVEQHGGLPIVAATLLCGTTTYAGGPFAAVLAGARHEPSAAPAD